jgi:ATP-dependent protease Clp ATPase subunit
MECRRSGHADTSRLLQRVGHGRSACFDDRQRDRNQAIAEEAARRQSGARGLRAILEEVMLVVMYEIPSLSGVKECVVTSDVVQSRGRPELVLESKAAS